MYVEPAPQPQTRQELLGWVHDHLRLPRRLEHDLLAAIDGVFARHERLWQESKQDAIQALSAGFADKMMKARRELSAKDATVSTISRYFEQLIADLTDKAHRDPKTNLMNFARFTDQLESFLALEQRGRWCAIGLADIAGFKRYNDSLGHALGDRIIERVANLLREQVRADDLVARERHESSGLFDADEDRVPIPRRELHARFGGDEFCFLVPDLNECQEAHTVAERFRAAVERHDWAAEDPRLAMQPVQVDVGVVCLSLGRVAERRFIARRIAAALIERADQLMYQAKSECAGRIHLVPLKIENGKPVEITDGPVTSCC